MKRMEKRPDVCGMLILAHTVTDELKSLLEVAALPHFLFANDSTVVAPCWTGSGENVT